jgi:hypothetical protein
MRRLVIVLAVVTMAMLFCAAESVAQTAGVLYTWNGTGNVHEWVGGSTSNAANVTNSAPGQLTVAELGDPVDPFDPGLAHVIRDGFNRRLETNTQQGGLDVYGLEALELDLSHNGSGPVQVQFFLQARPEFDYVWAGNDGTLNGPDWTLAPNVLHTLRFPLNLLTPAQQAYIRTVGLSVRSHVSVGNVTWNLFEVRSTGTSPTERIFSHNTGSDDNGLNGAFANFDLGTTTRTIVGNTGQNQTGLSHNPAGPGSLRWTDRGNGGNTANPSGAAVSWVNGTVFDGNTFNERLADFSNYNTVTFRMSATDALSAGGTLGVQAFFQVNNYTYHIAPAGNGVGASGEIHLPIDGQFHELAFPINALLPDTEPPVTGPADLQNVQAFGINLFAHMNDLVIDVDFVRFSEEELAPFGGDYNADGTVNAADYPVYRKSNGLVGSYETWRQHFGESSLGGSSPIPEPASLSVTAFCAALSSVAARRGKR